MSDWRPIDTYEEGKHVLFWMPHGERGIGGAETGMMFRDQLGGWDWSGVWTHGGPNAGSDFSLHEAPTHWMPLPNGPDKEDG